MSDPQSKPSGESSSKTRRTSGYLPSLDGWRAFAILGVLMTHDTPWRLGRFTNASWKGNGGDGVVLFFSISGLLICWRILEEESLVGKFHLKSFYIRRIFRIQPAALAYLAVIGAMIGLGWIQHYWSLWFASLFLYGNFLFHALNQPLRGSGLFTGHFWTLAVEEHFYILLSLLLFFVRKRRLLLTGLLVIGIFALQRIAISHGMYSPDVSQRRTYWNLQYLFWPAYAAMLLRLPQVRAFCDRWFQPWIVFSATILLVLAHETRDARHVVLNPFASDYWRVQRFLFLCFPLWMVATMLHPRSWTTRLLEWQPLRFVGRLSYSVYLWHVLFFFLLTEQVTYEPLRRLGGRPERYVLTGIAALLSYYRVEKPFIRMGHRLAPPATAGRLDMTQEPVETLPLTGETARIEQTAR